jgi:hypothetical protein
MVVELESRDGLACSCWWLAASQEALRLLMIRRAVSDLVVRIYTETVTEVSGPGKS